MPSDDILNQILDTLNKHSDYHMSNGTEIAAIKAKVFNGMSTNIEKTAKELENLSRRFDEHRSDFKEHIAGEHSLIKDTIDKSLASHIEGEHNEEVSNWFKGIFKNRQWIMRGIFALVSIVGMLVFYSPETQHGLLALLKLFGG